MRQAPGWSEHDLRTLDIAVREFDRLRVRQVCDRYVAYLRAAHAVDARVGVGVLRLLQRKRHGEELQDVAEALLAHDGPSVEVRHRYALALLDQDRPAAAESLLLTLAPQVRGSDPEVRGALARVLKQRYVLSAGRDAPALRAAIEGYLSAYRADPSGNLYHGVNAAALLVRAARDGVAVPGHPDPRAEAAAVAAAVLDAAGAVEDPGMWALATAGEACLALGRHDEAVVWLARYAAAPQVDAFEVGSTLRQLEQVWRLDARTHPGLVLLPLLRGRLLRAAGGSLAVREEDLGAPALARLQRASQAADGLEAVFGWARFQPLAWLRQALVACQSVARLEDHHGNGLGTGFVLDGAALRPGWAGRVLLTNAHVVPDALAVEDVHLTFRALSEPGQEALRFGAADLLWTSPRTQLDATVLALPASAPPSPAALAVRRRFPVLGPDHEVRAYVVGHPLGSPQLQLSLHDSLLLHADEVMAHYRSPTEQGSSGSPVFDDQWRCIALHHGWVPSVPGAPALDATPVNEGIRLDRLAAEVGAREAIDLRGTAPAARGTGAGEAG